MVNINPMFHKKYQNISSLAVVRWIHCGIAAFHSELQNSAKMSSAECLFPEMRNTIQRDSCSFHPRRFPRPSILFCQFERE